MIRHLHETPDQIPMPPDRPADETKQYGSNYDNRQLPFWFLTTSEHWLPTEAEVGYARRTVIARHDYALSILHTTDVGELETIADAGMRNVFTAIGLRTYRSSRNAAAEYGAPGLECHELTLVYDGVRGAATNLDTLLTPTENRHHFSLLPTKPGFFGAEDAVTHAVQGDMLASLEDSENDPDRRAWHDLVFHFPAWLCLPPRVTTAIYNLHCSVNQQYEQALDLPDDNPSKGEAVEIAQYEIYELLDSLEVINIHTVANLVKKENDAIASQLAKLLELPQHEVKEGILAHISSPTPENLLVTRII